MLVVTNFTIHVSAYMAKQTKQINNKENASRQTHTRNNKINEEKQQENTNGKA
jgi:hypothetical protein